MWRECSPAPEDGQCMSSEQFIRYEIHLATSAKTGKNHRAWVTGAAPASYALISEEALAVTCVSAWSDGMRASRHIAYIL